MRRWRGGRPARLVDKGYLRDRVEGRRLWGLEPAAKRIKQQAAVAAPHQRKAQACETHGPIAKVISRTSWPTARNSRAQ